MYGGHAAHGPEGGLVNPDSQKPNDAKVSKEDMESLGAGKTGQNQHDHGNTFSDSALTQIIGVAILEFGVTLHRCVLDRDAESSRWLVEQTPIVS
jgi:zinc transporter 1/2/3